MPGKCELSMKRSSCLLEIYKVRIKAVIDHNKHEACHTIDEGGERANCRNIIRCKKLDQKCSIFYCN